MMKSSICPKNKMITLFIGLNLCLSFHSTLSAQTFFFTHVPSVSAGSTGLAVWIKVPAIPRFAEGAPVAVYMPGGFDGEGIGDKEAGLVNKGFIEISMNFPGTGTGDKQSGGGPYDQRGPLSLRAVCDVLRFAQGHIPDKNGATLSDLVNTIVPLSNNVGLIGYSNGGNTNICVAGVHGEEIPNLAWILNWESPVGDGMPQAEAGAKAEGKLRPLNQETNPAYNPDTGVWDLSSLSWDDHVQIPLLDDTNQHVTGGLYFDINGNGRVDPGVDFIPYPLVFDVGGQLQGFYSVRLRQDAEQNGLFPDPAPSHIPSLNMTQTYWDIRNGEYWIESALTKIPNLIFMVVGSEIDHVQRALDHPHILIQYEGFRAGGSRFVRLNPDRTYVEDILGGSAPDAVDNDGLAHFDHMTIRTAVQPGRYDGPLGRDVIVPAAACELADRTHFNILDPQLDAIITSVNSPEFLPSKCILYQNHPNPFNNSTVIPYEVDDAGHVKISVFNFMGQHISTIFDSYQSAGKHDISLNADQWTTGVYFVRLTTASHQLIRRIVLLR